MYTSMEDHRSDLFLSGAVYVFGPFAVALLLRILPLGRVPGVGLVQIWVIPVLVTVLVPFLLMRYRDEPLSMYGLDRFDPAFGLGFVLALPVAAAGVLNALVLREAWSSSVPVAGGVDARIDLILAGALGWLCLALLAVYGTVKAGEAFHGTPLRVTEAAQRIGRIVGIVMVVATALLLLGQAGRPGFLREALVIVLPVVGVAVTALLAYRIVDGRETTTLPTLVTPVVLMGIGPLALRFDALALVLGIYLGSLAAAIGLVVGLLQVTRRTALGAVGLALGIALLTPIGPLGRF